jgi:hypothetical protein
MYVYDPFQHCCPTMNEHLDPETREDEYPLEYEPDIRKYSLVFREKGEDFGIRQQLWFCPWCGKKLPEKLSYKMEEVLEKEYGITEKDWSSPEWDDEKDLPEEFRTDEWWKKRGL